MGRVFLGATLFLTILSVLAGPCASADYYVQISVGNDANPGNGWGAGNALATIGQGVILANANPGADIVHVAAGSYNEHIDLAGDLTLLGGYPAAGGAVRDPAANPTIIDPGRTNNVINCESVANGVVDGFVLRNGYIEYRGGGVYIENSTGIIFNDNQIINNEARGDWGGGIAVVASQVQLTNNLIQTNITDSAGGGISFWDNCTGTVTGNTISENQAYDGGGIILDTGAVTIDNNVITNNRAEHGGGLYMVEASGSSISNNVIAGNRAVNDGGGINAQYSGAGISHNQIMSNISGNWGGGIHLYGNLGDLFDNLIINNQAVVGGGISYYDFAGSRVLNNTVANNTATSDGGGLFCYENSTSVITNSIFWDNAPDQILDHSGSGVTVSYSNVQGGYAGTGNINADPQFVSGYYLSQIASGQAVNSPSVDTGGDTATNLGLNNRNTRTDGVNDGGTVDMGYHYQGGIQHTVTFTAGANGSLTGETNQMVGDGGACTPVTASADNLYRFNGWTGDHVGLENPLTLTGIHSNMNVTANFNLNNAPTADNQNLAVNQDTPLGVILTGGDLDGDPITYHVDTQPTNGTLTGGPPDLVYTPGAGFTGADSFTFHTNDGYTDSNIATINITVNPVLTQYTVTFTAGPNGSLTGNVNQTVSEGGSTTPVTANPDAHFRFDGWTGDFVGTNNPLIVPNVTGNMAIQANFRANTAPTANNQNLETNKDTALNIMLTGNDADGDPIIYTLLSQPAHGNLTGNPPNLIYTPENGFIGPDNFTFNVNDGDADSNIATILIQVLKAGGGNTTGGCFISILPTAP